jgi:PrcB C-terminal
MKRLLLSLLTAIALGSAWQAASADDPAVASGPRANPQLTPPSGSVVSLRRPVPFRTVAIGDGSSSRLQKPTGLAVKSKARWRTLWRALGAGGKLPPVDFSRHMLLVASQGRQPSGGHQLRIASVGDPGDALVVDVTEVSPGPGCVTTGGITSPYHVVRVPRSDKPVRFVRHPKEKTCD